MKSEIFPSRYAADDPHLQEDQRQGKAARHPGAMLLNLALAHKDEGDAGGEHQQKSVYPSGNAERAGPAHALFKVLDVGSQRRRDQRTEHIHPADNAMQPEVTLSQTLGKLHRSEQNRAGAGKSMWQQPPAKWMVVFPRRIGRMNQEAFIVAKDIKDHQSDKRKQEVLRPQPGWTVLSDRAGRHGVFLSKLE